MTVKERTVPIDENEKVAEWRYEAFETMMPQGYDHLKLSQLAASHVSPHDLAHLLEKGCPPDLAYEILI